MLFADFSIKRSGLVIARTTDGEGDTNLIEGGVPAGIKIPPGEAGCRTKRSRISTITRHGNSKTRPRGIEIDELPFRRILRRKKANLGWWPFSLGASSNGRLGALGSRFVMRWMKLMSAIVVRSPE